MVIAPGYVRFRFQVERKCLRGLERGTPIVQRPYWHRPALTRYGAHGDIRKLGNGRAGETGRMEE